MLEFGMCFFLAYDTMQLHRITATKQVINFDPYCNLERIRRNSTEYSWRREIGTHSWFEISKG